MTHAELLALAERAEAADGADRELDKSLYYDLLGKCRHANKVWSGYQDDTGFDCPDCGADSWGNTGPTKQKLHEAIPAYTASVDAALMLGPTDWHMELRGVNDAWWCMLNTTWDGSRGAVAANAATPALAIVAASLRAIAEGVA